MRCGLVHGLEPLVSVIIVSVVRSVRVVWQQAVDVAIKALNIKAIFADKLNAAEFTNVKLQQMLREYVDNLKIDDFVFQDQLSNEYLLALLSALSKVPSVSALFGERVIAPNAIGFAALKCQHCVHLCCAEPRAGVCA